jgi:SAM-dependent methyltransferase
MPGAVQAIAAVSLSAALLAILKTNRTKPKKKQSQGRAQQGRAKGNTTQEERSDKSKGRARRSRFRGDGVNTTVVCVPNQQEYTKTIKYFVNEDDVVLELGCQRGETTQTLLQTANRVVGIDISRKEDGSEESVENSDNLKFLRTSVWNSKIQQEDQFSIIYVDLTVVTGNDLVFDGIALIQQLMNVFKSSLRFVVVKSKRLREHACCWRNADSVIKDLDPWTVDKRDKSRIKVLGAVGVQQYRNAIEKVVQEGDHALEIGAHFGCTTKLLHDRVGPTGSAVGVDIGKKALVRAAGKFPDVRFMEASAWDTHALVSKQASPSASSNCLTAFPFHLYLCIHAGEDLCFVQCHIHRHWWYVKCRLNSTLECPITLNVCAGVSGYDGLLEGIALITQLINVYRPSLKTIVVKSRAMRDHANVFITAEELMYDLKTGAMLNTNYHAVHRR